MSFYDKTPGKVRAKTDSFRRRQINDMIKSGQHLIAYKTQEGPGEFFYGDTRILTSREHPLKEIRPDIGPQYLVTRMDFTPGRESPVEVKAYNRKKNAEKAYDDWWFK